VEVARETRAGIDQRVRAVVGPERFEAARSVLLAGLDALEVGDRVRRRAVRPPANDLALGELER